MASEWDIRRLVDAWAALQKLRNRLGADAPPEVLRALSEAYRVLTEHVTRPAKSPRGDWPEKDERNAPLTSPGPGGYMMRRFVW